MVKDTVMESIGTVLHPRSIAIVGASPRLQYGGRFLNNLIETKYSGQLYPVNPRHEEIMGVRCYPDISSLPETPDLAGIIIPAEKTMDILEQCAQKGIKTGVIITGGFAELGTAERRSAQKAMSDLTARTGMRLCGPNCLGIANVVNNIWPCSARLSDIQASTTGSLALVSQSGASAFGPFLLRAQDRGLGFSYIVSTGNEADLDTSDFISYCIRQPEVKAIIAYFESIKDTNKFRNVTEEALALGKPIVALKIGRSSAGQRAARSHTASMTGSDQAYDSLFKQMGVIRVEDWDELLEVASFLAKTPPFARETIGVMAHSGGVASLLADKCEQVMSMPQTSAITRQGLDDILKGFGSPANPADVTWHAFEEEFSDILKLMLDDDRFGGVVLGTAGDENQARRIIKASERTDKPLAMLWTGSEKDVSGLPLIQQSNRVPVFFRAENLAKALKASVNYHKTRTRRAKGAARKMAAPSRPELKITGGKGPLGLQESLELLSSSGITTARGNLVQTPEEAVRMAGEIGYPVALKMDSPGLPHKTELGLVKAGLNSEEELRDAFEDIEKKLQAVGKSAPINGFLVQEMVADGVEVITGIKREPQMGPVLLFGLGGIFTEVMKDFSLRVCPATQSDIKEMVREIKGYKLLEGFRGGPRADIEALEKTLLKVSQLALALKDRVEEIDINPLIVLARGQGVLAIDALIVRG